MAKAIPPIVLGFFARGLNTNRQPLFSALTGVGLQVIQFKDYLIDGINVECSDHFTLQRAPGFTKFCTTQLAVSEVIKQFYSTRDLSGNVYPLVDTNQNLYNMTPTTLTSLLTKGTTAQGYIQQVGGVTYYANGTDLKKWLPAASSMVPWGVAAPTIAPSVFPFNTVGGHNWNFWAPQTGAVYSQNCSILDANGNIEVQLVAGTPRTGTSIPVWSTSNGGSVLDNAAKWENEGPAGAWQASTAYAKHTVIVDSNNNIQLVTTAGTSGATAPSWSATFGATTTDSGVTWTNVGFGLVQAFSGYSYVFCYRTVSGNLSTGSPATSTGPIMGSTSTAPINITAWSITSNVVTFTANNTLSVGSGVVLSGFDSAASFFNGFTGIVSATGLSGTQFEIAFTHANGSGSDAGLANVVVATVQGASSSNSECNSTATITSVQVAAGVVTVTAANNFTPGINVRCSGLTGATFLNGVTLQVQSATAISFTLSLPAQANYGPTGDSGTATFYAVEVYRTEDGGGVYYFDGAALNGGTWTFYDTAADSQLDTELVASPAGTHLNDPPPGQTGSTVTTGGTLLAWWSNRLWMAVGNKLYFSGGPDILNGVPEECWPPGNVFVMPGQINSLNATTGGLVVGLPEDVWAILGGPQTVSFYPDKILSRFGVLSQNCVKQDGDILYLYNSQQQLMVLSGAGKAELGAGNSGISPVGDLLHNGQTTSIATVSAWPAASSYLTIHRQGEDSGIYLSNGVESLIRYGVNVGNFSPVRQPLVTGSANCGAINSVETSAGQYSLLMAPTTAHDYIYTRNLSTFSDNTHAYASSAVIGNIVVTEPGQPLTAIQAIAAYLYNRGTVPSLGFFPNDITPTTFISLPVTLPEPALLPAPTNLMSKRWPLMLNTSATPILTRHLQVKVDFGNTDTVKNELIELSLLPAVTEMVIQ